MQLAPSLYECSLIYINTVELARVRFQLWALRAVKSTGSRTPLFGQSIHSATGFSSMLIPCAWSPSSSGKRIPASRGLGQGRGARSLLTQHHRLR